MGRSRFATTDVVVGIDPGLSGALALLDVESKFMTVLSMPSRMKASGRREVDPEALLDELSPLLRHRKPLGFVIERVSAMPGQGVSGMFSLGDSFGVVRAIAESYFPAKLKYVSASVWKKSLGLTGKDKAASLSLARRLYPAARPHLYRKKDEGRAEALLLAHYGRKVLLW